uniref:Uncharacterized protein n=1 Tax=Glossina pallidipes TaxID=7398 RepID=A0A1A9ZJS9_GLOPL
MKRLREKEKYGTHELRDAHSKCTEFGHSRSRLLRKDLKPVNAWTKCWTIPNNIIPAEPLFNKTNNVGALIGVELYPDILKGREKELRNKFARRSRWRSSSN